MQLRKISVVNVSLNQPGFLERTLCSVPNHGYTNLEYVVIDGGSTDGSVDIIRRYADRLTYWDSEQGAGLIIGVMSMIDVKHHILRDIKNVPRTYGAMLAEGMVATNQSAVSWRVRHQQLGFLRYYHHFGFDFERFLAYVKRCLRNVLWQT